MFTILIPSRGSWFILR